MKIRPLDDRVVVLPLEAQAVSRGGIHIPDQAKEKPQRGKILAVGPGKMLDSGERARLALKVGDEVYFAKYAGSDIELDGVKVTVLHESEILGVVE